eukprot:4629690-Pyramimonas_sp.AAC.1
MNVNLVAVGDTVCSTEGVPIGEFLSRSAASLVLNVAEHNWNTTFDSRGRSWKSLVAMLRYVDDALLLSFSVCRRCMAQQLERIYPIKFDVGAESRILRWLDVEFDLDRLVHKFCFTKDICVLPLGRALCQRFAPISCHV